MEEQINQLNQIIIQFFFYATQGQKNLPIPKPQGTQTMKSSNINLKEQLISSNPSYTSNSNKTAEKPKTLCKVCNREFERILAHYSRSPSCKPGPELQADQMSKKCDSARNLDLIKDKKSATNPQSEKKTQIDEIKNTVVTERIEPTLKELYVRVVEKNLCEFSAISINHLNANQKMTLCY